MNANVTRLARGLVVLLALTLTMTTGLPGVVPIANAWNQSPTPSPTGTRVSTATPTKTPTQGTSTNMMLNLSHIDCVDSRIEVHFVVVHVPDSVTDSQL